MEEPETAHVGLRSVPIRRILLASLVGMPNAEPSKLHGISVTNAALEGVCLALMPQDWTSWAQYGQTDVNQILLCQDRHALKGSPETNRFFSACTITMAPWICLVYMYVFIYQQLSIKEVHGPWGLLVCLWLIRGGDKMSWHVLTFELDQILSQSHCSFCWLKYKLSIFKDSRPGVMLWSWWRVGLPVASVNRNALDPLSVSAIGFVAILFHCNH